jgi:hypothetical protein
MAVLPRSTLTFFTSDDETVPLLLMPCVMKVLPDDNVVSLTEESILTSQASQLPKHIEEQASV